MTSLLHSFLTHTDDRVPQLLRLSLAGEGALTIRQKATLYLCQILLYFFIASILYGTRQIVSIHRTAHCRGTVT